jgi:hypothetical protein
VNSDVITYRYKWHIVPLVWTITALPLSISLSITAVREYGGLEALAISSIALLFVLIVDWLIFMSVSDIRISDTEIARSAYGVTWQRLKWSDIERVSIRQTMNYQDGARTRSFALRGKKKSSSLLSRVIIFQERPDSMKPLIEKLTSCAKHHQLPIVDWTSH